MERVIFSACIHSGLIASLLAMPVAASDSIVSGIDEQAQLPFWEYNNGAMSLRLVQRLPDQTRAFFTARGFTPEQAELIAQSCVFQTVFKNVSHTSDPSPLHYDLKEWVVRHQGERRRMKLREDWSRQWQENNIPKPAQIAFEWSLYPTTQTYRPSDYNWGMSIFNLKPGSRFDLEFSWTQHEKLQTAVIRDIQCAPDLEADSIE